MGYRNMKLSTHTFMICEGISIALMFGAAGYRRQGRRRRHSLGKPLRSERHLASGLSAALVFGFDVHRLRGLRHSRRAGIKEPVRRRAARSIQRGHPRRGRVHRNLQCADDRLRPDGRGRQGVRGISGAEHGPGHPIREAPASPTAPTVGTALSTFACALASADGAAPGDFFSLSRDKRLPDRLTVVAPQEPPSPHIALAVAIIVGMAISEAFDRYTSSPSDVYGWTGALATLAVIIAYGMTSIAATIYFWRQDIQRCAARQLPAAGRSGRAAWVHLLQPNHPGRLSTVMRKSCLVVGCSPGWRSPDFPAGGR